MFKKTTIDFKSSGVLSPLVSDYLNKNEKLNSFYGFFPDENGFKNLLNTHPYANFKREELSRILNQQSKRVSNSTEASLNNINKLKKEKTFTVTTGHQLCLFTGPLYFVYKIFSTINLAESLSKKFPGFDFVPIYWMASEDHDFEEVNHFNSSGKTITWKSSQAGAVGDFKTEELKKLFPALSELLGRSENADYLITLFENTYLKHTDLADATRFLVNELFGEYGLITIDGNDKDFKQQVRKEFRADLFDHSPYEKVNASIAELERSGYSAQVNPREINCFYIEKGVRVRLEKAGDVYNLVGTKRSLTKNELEEIIEKSPEKLSPNVLLRPVYQQVILPNIAYIGGPGELAYWLEFKNMFDSLGVFFPVLMPRNFILVADKLTVTKITKLNFSVSDFFKQERDLIKQLQVKKDEVFDLEKEKESITAFYAKILDRASVTDKTLSGSVSAELKRTMNGFDRISGKTNRAIRRKFESEINQIHVVKEHLFPRNVPQERYENFSSFYLSYGKTFLNEIKEKADPFLLEQSIFTEE